MRPRRLRVTRSGRRSRADPRGDAGGRARGRDPSPQRNPPLVALVASIGGTLGEISGYLVGYGGRAFIAPDQSERYQMAERWMQRRGGFAIFLFALVPFFIFDFVGIAAGVFRYPVKKFLLYAWLGRLPRSFIEVYVGSSLLDAIMDHLPF